MNAGTRIDSSTLWDGNAGQIAGNVGNLTLNDGAQIRSQSGGVAVVSGQPSVGFGKGGSVTFTADDSILITGSNSAVSTNTFGNGNGGSISLIAGKASEHTEWRKGAVPIAEEQLSEASSSLAVVVAGDITITAGDQIAMNSGSVSTRAVTADGGNITLNAPRMIQLTDSQVTTSVESGVGTGGNITIDPQALILNNSRILANAFGGPGGNINITADVFLVNSNGAFPTSLTGIVDASSALSTPGTVNIEATFTNVVGSVDSITVNAASGHGTSAGIVRSEVRRRKDQQSSGWWARRSPSPAGRSVTEPALCSKRCEHGRNRRQK